MLLVVRSLPIQRRLLLLLLQTLLREGLLLLLSLRIERRLLLLLSLTLNGGCWLIESIEAPNGTPQQGNSIWLIMPARFDDTRRTPFLETADHLGGNTSCESAKWNPGSWVVEPWPEPTSRSSVLAGQKGSSRKIKGKKAPEPSDKPRLSDPRCCGFCPVPKPGRGGT